MQIIRAEHLGMCFGVRDAIALAVGRAETAPLTVLGELVHNAGVLQALNAKGVAIAHDPAQVETHTVMVTAHGASARALARVRARGLEVVEATCPLVQVAHRAVKALVDDGYHPVIIGRRTHVEVRGMTEDLDAFDVVLDESDVLRIEPHARLGVAAQTTQPIGRVQYLVDLIRARFPQSDVRFIDTVCRPTKERQSAAAELAGRCDVVIVVGGANSNNTHELVNTSRRYCSRVHHVQTELDVRAEWVLGADVVGITAGTSTPDDVIDRVDQQIQGLSTHRSHSASYPETIAK
jgi:4-hydroxy-3-methylbut-2-enyl diphosphate reductase